tara:strand:+ start:329 stop:685 length:357 start_codon:yes stop_codon:yes gene_type:complete
MNLRNSVEFFKWALTRPLGLLPPDIKFHDRYMQDIIDEELKPSLDRIKKTCSPESLENGTFGLYKHFFGEIPGTEIDELEDFRPGNYSGVSNLYSFCSWRLNKEFRSLHDQISNYLHN